MKCKRVFWDIQWEDIGFLFIFTIGAIFRFYQYSHYTITNDEMAAIVQSSTGNLHDLYKTVAGGVHPFGYYFFLHYWIGLFGKGLLMLRLPFIFFGLGSIIMLYLIGSRWFGKFSALLAATCLSLFSFPVLYSQLARPYSIGLFISLVAIYFWTLLVFPTRHQKALWLPFFGFIIASWLAMLMHYFGLMEIAVAGLLGLLFVRGRRMVFYVVAGVALIILYLPFAGIFMSHIGASGLDWLGKPDSSFLLTFLLTVFNNDHLLFYAFLLVILVLAWQARKRLHWGRFHTIALLMFVIPFVIAYMKSVFGKPVLQDRALLFQLPYLLLFVSAFQYIEQKDINHRILRFSLWGLFTLLSMYSFVYRVQYASNGYKDFGNFQAASVDLLAHYQQYHQNVSWAASVNRPYYAQYYFMQKEFAPLKYELTRCDDKVGLDSLVVAVGKATTPFFYFWWCHTDYQGEVDNIIRQQYPIVVDYTKEPRYGMEFFAKDVAWGDTLFYQNLLIDNSITNVKTNDLYSMNFNFPDTIHWQQVDRLVVKAKVKPLRKGSASPTLVFETNDGQVKTRVSNLEQYYQCQHDWNTAYLLTDLPKNQAVNKGKMKVYIYNPGGFEFQVRDFEIIAYHIK